MFYLDGINKIFIYFYPNNFKFVIIKYNYNYYHKAALYPT